MPIIVRCSACQARYQVGEALAGKSFACKKCQTVVTIPNASATTAQGEAAPSSLQQSAAQPAAAAANGATPPTARPTAPQHTALPNQSGYRLSLFDDEPSVAEATTAQATAAQATASQLGLAPEASAGNGTPQPRPAGAPRPQQAVSAGAVAAPAAEDEFGLADAGPASGGLMAGDLLGSQPAGQSAGMGLPPVGLPAGNGAAPAGFGLGTPGLPSAGQGGYPRPGDATEGHAGQPRTRRDAAKGSSSQNGLAGWLMAGGLGLGVLVMLVLLVIQVLNNRRSSSENELVVVETPNQQGEPQNNQQTTLAQKPAVQTPPAQRTPAQRTPIAPSTAPRASVAGEPSGKPMIALDFILPEMNVAMVLRPSRLMDLPPMKLPGVQSLLRARGNDELVSAWSGLDLTVTLGIMDASSGSPNVLMVFVTRDSSSADALINGLVKPEDPLTISTNYQGKQYFVKGDGLTACHRWSDTVILLTPRSTLLRRVFRGEGGQMTELARQMSKTPADAELAMVLEVTEAIKSEFRPDGTGFGGNQLEMLVISEMVRSTQSLNASLMMLPDPHLRIKLDLTPNAPLDRVESSARAGLLKAQATLSQMLAQQWQRQLPREYEAQRQAQDMLVQAVRGAQVTTEGNSLVVTMDNFITMDELTSMIQRAASAALPGASSTGRPPRRPTLPLGNQFSDPPARGPEERAAQGSIAQERRPQPPRPGSPQPLPSRPSGIDQSGNGPKPRTNNGPVMEVAGPTLSRKFFRSEDYRGKVVLVDFWAIWCPYCLPEIPHMKEVYQKYHDQGFEIVGVSLDPEPRKVRTFIKEKGMPWPQIFFTRPNQRGWNSPLVKQCKVNSIPAMFLLDHEGRVITTKVRGAGRLEKAVQDALKQAKLATEANQQKITSNLQQIRLGILNHAQVNSGQPPIGIRNKDGELLASWRVQILPFIEQQDLYDQFEFSKPWDHPENKKLLDQMPSIFEHPEIKLPAGKTAILAVQGEGFYLDPAQQREGSTAPLDAISDGRSNTVVAVVAKATKAVEWTSPRDFTPDFRFSHMGLYVDAEGKVTLMMADGSLRRIPLKKLNRNIFKAMVTVNGGEQVALPE